MHGEAGGGGNRVVPVRRNSRADRNRNVDRSVSQTERQRAPVTKTELGPREYEVLLGIADGLTNSEIGKSLYLSEDTIRTYTQRMFRKMEARSRAHAVAIGFSTGLLIPSTTGHSERWRLEARLGEYTREIERLKKAAVECSCRSAA